MTDRLPSDIDLQDPLPESNWFWRRVLTFLAVVIVFALMVGLSYAVHRIVGGVVEKLAEISGKDVAEITVRALGVIETMFMLMFWALIVIVTNYMVAPSAEQITKMLKTAALLKSGVKMSSRAVVREPHREIDTATTAGVPDTPPILPVGRDSGVPGSETPAARRNASEVPPWDQKG